jgi:hypothetical protein
MRRGVSGKRLKGPVEAEAAVTSGDWSAGMAPCILSPVGGSRKREREKRGESFCGLSNNRQDWLGLAPSTLFLVARIAQWPLQASLEWFILLCRQNW